MEGGGCRPGGWLEYINEFSSRGAMDCGTRCVVLSGGIGCTRQRETHWFRWTWGLVSFCVVGLGGDAVRI
jgi:hypothetical protein